MEISEDQQTITVAPTVPAGTYVAVDHVEGRAECANCAFYGDQSECAEAPCMEWERTDGRSVIFIKSE